MDTVLEAGEERLLERVQALIVSRARPMKPVTVLVDGPSGAGKTWFSARLAERTGFAAVHLDEFYPGWHGLSRGAQMVPEQVLRQTNPGYWRWDWAANAPGEWLSLDARDDLIVEGVGAVTPQSLAAARERGGAVAVLITGPRQQRRARAIERDPDYEDWFEGWEQQEKEHFAAQREAGVEFDASWDWAEGPRAEGSDPADPDPDFDAEAQR